MNKSTDTGGADLFRQGAGRATEQAVREHLLSRIRSTDGAPTRLESEWSLVERFGLPRRTVRRVLQQLVRDGTATVRRGQGYWSRAATPEPAAGRPRVALVHHPAGPMSRRAQECVLELALGQLRSTGLRPVSLPMPTPEAGSASSVQGHAVDAFILLSVSPALQALFAAQSKPAVVLGNTFLDLGLPNIWVNELDTADHVAGWLLAEGYRGIVLLQERVFNIGVERSRIGFEAAHHRAQVRFSRDQIIRLDRSRRGVVESMKKLRDLKPQAIIAHNASLLAMVEREAKSYGLTPLPWTWAGLLGPDTANELGRPVPRVEYNLPHEFALAGELIKAALAGRTVDRPHREMKWRFESAPNRATTRQPITTNGATR